MADELTIASYIGTDECSECGKTDEVISLSDELSACQECINKAFAEHWGDTKAATVVSKVESPAQANSELGKIPLCPVHQRLDMTSGVDMTYGNGCVACSLNERTDLLNILGMIADGSKDSVSVLHDVVEFYTTHQGENRVVVSYPAPVPSPAQDAPEGKSSTETISIPFDKGCPFCGVVPSPQPSGGAMVIHDEGCFFLSYGVLMCLQMLDASQVAQWNVRADLARSTTEEEFAQTTFERDDLTERYNLVWAERQEARQDCDRLRTSLATIRRDTWDEAMEIANTCLQSHSPVKDDNGDIVNHGNSASCIYFALEAARELSHEQRTK